MSTNFPDYEQTWIRDKNGMHPRTYPTYFVEFSAIDADGLKSWINHLREKNWFTPYSEKTFIRTYENYLNRKEEKQ